MSKWRSSCRYPTWRGGSDVAALRDAEPDRGVALPGALVLVALLVAVSGWVLGHIRDDATQALVARAFDEQSVVADGALAIISTALGLVPDWRPVTGLAPGPPCPAGGAVVPVDPVAEGAWAQAETDAASRWGADTPRWQLVWHCHASAVLGRWPGPGLVPSVLVWVADDPEGDGTPALSTNQRLLVRAVSVGPSGARAVVSAVIDRAGPGTPVRLVAMYARGEG